MGKNLTCSWLGLVLWVKTKPALVNGTKFNGIKTKKLRTWVSMTRLLVTNITLRFDITWLHLTIFINNYSKLITPK